MERKYKHQLITLNELSNGSRLDLWRSIAHYNLKYLFLRPIITCQIGWTEKIK